MSALSTSACPDHQRISPALPTQTTSPSTAPLPADATDWDAAAVFLGSNYDGDKENYDTKMREILDRLAPRPTLLFTVTEYRPNYSDVTAVINDLAAAYPNVTLTDWAAAARTPGVLLPDGLHPNDVGEIHVLANLTAEALGEAPAGEAECIRSQFRDDSAIDEGNGSPNTGGSTSGAPRARSHNTQHRFTRDDDCCYAADRWFRCCAASVAPTSASCRRLLCRRLLCRRLLCRRLLCRRLLCRRLLCRRLLCRRLLCRRLLCRRLLCRRLLCRRLLCRRLLSPTTACADDCSGDAVTSWG